MPNDQKQSNRNRPKHRKLANSIVLQGESVIHFGQLVNSLIDDFQPRTPVEHLMIEKMAVAQWRQARLWSMSKAVTEHHGLQHPRPDAALRDGLTLLANPEDKEIPLQELRFDRQFNRTMNSLIKLRSFREAGEKRKNCAIEPGI